MMPGIPGETTLLKDCSASRYNRPPSHPLIPMSNTAATSTLAAQARRQHQGEQLDVLVNLPPETQAGAALALWPGRLPQLARKRLSAQVQAQWRDLRKAKKDRHAFYRSEIITLRQALSSSQRLAIQQFGYHAELLRRHAVQAEGIYSFLQSIQQEKVLSVGVEGRDDEGYSLHFLGGEAGQQNSLRIMAKRLMCVALEQGGVVLIHHQLPMMALVNGKEPAWRHQERLYGFRCGQGKWSAITPDELRRAHQESGNTGPSQITFGQATWPMKSTPHAP